MKREFLRDRSEAHDNSSKPAIERDQTATFSWIGCLKRLVRVPYEGHTSSRPRPPACNHKLTFPSETTIATKKGYSIVERRRRRWTWSSQAVWVQVSSGGGQFHAKLERLAHQPDESD
jgi:hypothetical protein